jgi:hypothetical protein
VTQALTTANEEWIDTLFDAVVSVFQRTGYFDRTNKHEAKKRPNKGLHAAVWFQNMRSVGAISGLASSSALVTFIGRIYSDMLKEPQDEIDPAMMRAASNVMRSFHGNFDFGLGSFVRNVDVLGETGTQLDATAGYLAIGQTMFRVIDITVPVIVNDVWDQIA